MGIWYRILDGVAELGWGGLLGLDEPAPVSLAVPGAAPNPGTRQVGFTIAVVALGAKMAGADGVVSPDEVRAFHEVFQAPPEERENVAYFFDLARRSTTGAETYARQAARLLGGDKGVLEDLLGALFHIARADGRFDPSEDAYLRRIAGIFGFSEDEYRRIRAFHVGAAEGAGIEDDPWLILGLPEGASLAEVKARWRALVRENHPDRAIAAGLPAEFVAIATAKLARINAAYEALKSPEGDDEAG